MPPRLVTTAIIVFWLATTSVLIYREVAPRFRAGDAPPFSIDLTEEVSASLVHWSLLQQGEKIGAGATRVKRQPDRTYEFSADFKLDPGKRFKLLVIDLQEFHLDSRYRVTEEGHLVSGAAELDVAAQAPVLGLVAGKVNFQGEVREREFHPELRIIFSGAELPLPPLKPFAVSDSGSILNPMHLVHKITGLREGAVWRVPLMDPLRAVPDAIQGLMPGKDAVTNELWAAVTVEDHRWNGASESCFKISYAKRDERPLAATWVRRRDSLVLEQWAGYEGIEYTLVRGPGQ